MSIKRIGWGKKRGGLIDYCELKAILEHVNLVFEFAGFEFVWREAWADEKLSHSPSLARRNGALRPNPCGIRPEDGLDSPRRWLLGHPQAPFRFSQDLAAYRRR